MAHQFTIDGRDYPVPQIATFTMDEAAILWDYTGWSLPDFAADDNGQYTDDRVREILTMMRNPLYLRTLLHVAYRRGNPDVDEPSVQRAVGAVPMVEALTAWLDTLEEDDAGPPASTTGPEASSPNGSDDSNGSSGTGSSTSSDSHQDSRPVTTGITASVTSSHPFTLTG